MKTPLPLAAAAASISIGDKSLSVTPAKLPELLRVVQLTDEGDLLQIGYQLFLAAGSPQGVDPRLLFKALASGGHRLAEAFAVLLRIERAELDALDLDDVVVACAAAVEVNLDFFTQRLMTKLEELVTTSSTLQSVASGMAPATSELASDQASAAKG